MAVTERDIVPIGPEVQSGVGFRATVPGLAAAATNELSYYFGGLVEKTRQIAVYGNQVEAGYNYKDHIPRGFEAYGPSYVGTTNPQHAADVTRFIIDREKLREDQSVTPIGTTLVAGLTNPANLLVIPLGLAATAGRTALTTTAKVVSTTALTATSKTVTTIGPRVAPISLGRTALEAGVTVGGTELALNLGIQATDPVQTWTESTVNAATAALFGGAVTGVFAAPLVSKLNALSKVREQSSAILTAAQSVENMGGTSSGVLERFAQRDARPLGQTENVDEALVTLNSRLDGLQSQLVVIPEGSGEARIINDQIEQLRIERQGLADEAFFRKVEEQGVDLNDLYRPSAGADNFFINFVTNPFRRGITGNFGVANNDVKKAFVMIAGDGGTQLKLHEAGVSAPLSVHQLSAKDMGEFAVLHDGMAKLWAEDTGAPAIGTGTSILSNPDVNLTSISRAAQGNGSTKTAWITDVNRKRITGGDMTPAQAKAAKMLDNYLGVWEERLIDTGQLRNKTTLGRQLNELRLEVDALQAKVDQAPADQVQKLNETLSQRKSVLDETQFEFDNPMLVEKAEAVFPRYWNAGAIKAKPDKLKKILTDWYAENPYIIRFSEDNMKWERVDLPTDADAIAKRADETIETILGNRVDEDGQQNVFTGAGRPTALRSRQLDIPNSKVFEFIEQNPINVLASYTSRTSSSYHFAKQFKGNRGKVVGELRSKMEAAGVSTQKIQATIRDFNHLYDRVVGRVVQNPEAWNQKAAAVLRDAASLTYLGGAGIAAIGDFGRIIMEHEGQNIVRTAQALFDPAIRRASSDQVRAVGGALDMLLGSAHLRMADDQNYNVLSNGMMDRARNAFHTMNLLGPVTVLGKQFTGALSGHYLIQLSNKLARGEADEFEIRYLARHNIDADLAKRISVSPYQLKGDTGFILPNADEWADGYAVPTVDGNRVRIIEVMEDGSSVGKTNEAGEYVSAYYRPDEEGAGGTIYFDREHIEGEKFNEKAWTKPRMEGVKPLPEDAFKTPRAWANFAMWHEIMHTRFSAEDLNLPPRSPAYENKINDLAMAEHKKSQTVAQDTADRFKVAVNTSISNTVLMATAADKPIIMDGVVYVREEFGAMFGLLPDPKNLGYSRIENAFMALPFQFYAYSFANVNKTVGLMMQNGVRSRMTGVAAMMGLGYMITSIRTPDQIWEKMPIQDKIARSFDMGGVAALYSDLFYTSLQTSLALGGPNLTGGIVSPRFPQKPNMVDAVTGLTGASSSWIADMARSAGAFANGEYGEGAAMFIKNLPFSNLWFLRGEVNEMARTLSRN
jgi:hypothetical protein